MLPLSNKMPKARIIVPSRNEAGSKFQPDNFSPWYIILAAYRRACPVQSGMSGPCSCRRLSLLGRWLLPRVRQHSSAFSAVSWRSDLRGAANTLQLRRQQLLQPLDLACGTLFRSSCAIQTSDDSWRDTFFSGSMNTTAAT